MKKVFLKKFGDQKAEQGHQWIFSNHIDRTESEPQNGEVVSVYNDKNHFFGKAFYNKNSLISLRILTQKDEEIDKDFFAKRILAANNFRKKLYPDSNIYRMVFSESDFLPGLIIDRFNDTYSIQINSLGMELLMPLLIDIIKEEFKPECIIEKNESSLRLLEGMELRSGLLYGTHEEMEAEIDSIKYNLNLLTGQKSGFFLDQRENRKAIRKYVKDCEVLDCFCNEGGFALSAAFAGAKKVTGLDISASAISKCQTNSLLNKFDSICSFEKADVFEALEKFNIEKRCFDAIIIDPPSFTKSKKNIPTARKAYKKINMLGMSLLRDNGYLITSSCSHHIDEITFLETIREAAHKARVVLKMLEFHSAAPDHPSLLSMPETIYLKFGIFSVHKY